jgi:hypothetical protein
VLIVDPLTQAVVARFELWRSVVPATSGLCLTRAGLKGDQARSMLSADYELIWTVEGVSYFEVMTKYYTYMDWGEYRCEWPDLSVIPFFYNDAIEVLKALPKKIRPLSEISISADGQTNPLIPSPIPLIEIRDLVVWSVKVWIFGDFGSHSESPLNQPELITAAAALICSTQPDLLNRRTPTLLICPIEIAEQMVWIPTTSEVNSYV